MFYLKNSMIRSVPRSRWIMPYPSQIHSWRSLSWSQLLDRRAAGENGICAWSPLQSLPNSSKTYLKSKIGEICRIKSMDNKMWVYVWSHLCWGLEQADKSLWAASLISISNNSFSSTSLFFITGTFFFFGRPFRNIISANPSSRRVVSMLL